jgi:hypothetical protein
MRDFKVKVELTCKSCNQKFYSTIPDEIHIQPQYPNVKPITFTIEELRGNVTKDVKDISGKVIGRADVGGFQFEIGHPRCGNTNKYSVNDCTFLPS